MKNKITFFTVLLIVATIFSPLFSQTQIGSDIDGEADGDGSSRSSLSSDGSRIAIGAPYNDGNGNNAGHVRVFEFDGTVWTQIGEDIDGEGWDDRSGWSVSLSSDGSHVAIGAPELNANGGETGYVRVFKFDGMVWTQVGEDIYGEAEKDWSGYSISLSSDASRVAIGAPRNNGNGNKRGHVRVFEWNGVVWTQIGEDIDGEGWDDWSGWSVSLSSDASRVAIGAPYNDGNGTEAGHVRVFEWNGVVWTQIGEDIDGEEWDDRSGWSVSLSSDGSHVAIGAPYSYNEFGVRRGHVRVFEWNGVVWTQIGEDIDGEAVEDESGYHISLSSDGNRIAIGAPHNDGYICNAGHVRVFEWNGVVWTQIGEDIDGENPNNWSGWSVSISSDGSKVAIGAPGNSGNGTTRGHVRVFEFTTVSTIASNIKSITEIYPNPTTGKIEMIGVEYGAIKIIDNFGRIIMEAEISEDEIDISDLSPGIYFIQIIMDDQMVTKKIIKI